MEVREYAELDATGLKEIIDKGEVTADEVREAAAAAIEEVQPRLNALVGPLLDPPAPGSPDGPFAGVPFLIKDLVCSAEGVAQESGSRLFAGYVADHDSTLMTRFKQAGLTTIGRTATPELGFNANTAPIVNGPTRNPWDVDHIPGGSSGGSAALVAARTVPMAHANDGGGSIRIPAACTGLVGLKPTRGRVPLGPDVGLRHAARHPEGRRRVHRVLCAELARGPALPLSHPQPQHPGSTPHHRSSRRFPAGRPGSVLQGNGGAGRLEREGG